MKAYRLATFISSLALIGLGGAITIYTALAGGGYGLMVGPAFVVAGLGRLYLLLRR